MKKWQLVVIIAVVAALAAGVGAYAATNYGTQSDPLISLSYLTDTLEPAIRGELDKSIDAAMDSLEDKFQQELSSATGSFRVVTLGGGKTLTVGEGCEILLRSGSVTASGSFTDVTGGSTLTSGAPLTENHLYMSSSSGTLTAASDATLLVRGVCAEG